MQSREFKQSNDAKKHLSHLIVVMSRIQPMQIDVGTLNGS